MLFALSASYLQTGAELRDSDFILIIAEGDLIATSEALDSASDWFCSELRDSAFILSQKAT